MVKIRNMLTEDFYYDLPKKLIAKQPVSPRDASRLMVLNRENESIKHHVFGDLPGLLSSDYLLVFNKTKVFPARLKVCIDDKKCELLLLRPADENVWEVMVKPGKLFKKGTKIKIEGKIEEISAKVVSIQEDGTRLVEFNTSCSMQDWAEKNGYPPFPPYIKDSKANMNEYQTIYAEETGSVAAPTAGLHFTENVFENLKKKKIDYCNLTLHVGRGTFMPVKEEKISAHRMHEELYEISEEAVEKLNRAKMEGKKILAIGTTSVRTLEANFKNSKFHEKKSKTDIFIYPGYKFNATDAMLTNFHLPKSTLIMLISAFAGKDFIFRAYEEAIKENYRFYSFGDAMLIL